MSRWGTPIPLANHNCPAAGCGALMLPNADGHSTVQQAAVWQGRGSSDALNCFLCRDGLIKRARTFIHQHPCRCVACPGRASSRLLLAPVLARQGRQQAQRDGALVPERDIRLPVLHSVHPNGGVRLCPVIASGCGAVVRGNMCAGAAEGCQRAACAGARQFARRNVSLAAA